MRGCIAMGILDELEKIDRADSMLAHWRSVERNQKKIIELLEQILEELRKKKR
jgi:hypothetical protein